MGDRWLFYLFNSWINSSFAIIYLLAQKERDALYFWEKGFKEVKILLPCSWSSGYLFWSSIGGCFFSYSIIILVDNKYIFQKLLSILYSNGQPTFLSTVLSFILTVVVAPILEELIHRGYFMNTFFHQSKYYLDVILSALIFGLSHLILTHRDPISLIIYSLGGLFYALVYRWTKNLKITILCHSFFNFLIYAKPIWIFVYNYVYYHFLR